MNNGPQNPSLTKQGADAVFNMNVTLSTRKLVLFFFTLALVFLVPITRLAFLVHYSVDTGFPQGNDHRVEGPLRQSLRGADANKSANVLHRINGTLPATLGGRLDIINDASKKSSQANETTRRTRAHFCKWKAHNGITIDILTNEFGFTEVDAMQNEEWDLIYGGYPHCGKRRRRSKLDWNMRSGLIPYIAKEVGWSNLKPHQVFFPCMGCRQSYCNKYELCSLIRDSGFDDCFLLPQDYKRLKSQMDGGRRFVRKIDGPNLHMHLSTGVEFIQSMTKLPSQQELTNAQKNGTYYLVQPYHDPYLGPGIYHRKMELRIFLAVTSVFPLRVYAHDNMQVFLSTDLYYETSNKTGDDGNDCALQTRVHSNGCQASDMSEENRYMLFDEYADRVGMSNKTRDSVIQNALRFISWVLQASQPVLQSQPINLGLNQSGAMCFSHLRADLGITNQLKPVLYEINEFPHVGGTYKGAGDKQTVFRDLFRMIGLDEAPLPAEKRAQWEANHLGGFKLLPNLV